MRTLDFHRADIERIVLVTEPTDLRNDNIDVWVHLKDGRTFSFTVLTVENLRSFVSAEGTFATPGMLVVTELSDKLIIDAILEAWQGGIQNFGVLQTGESTS